MHNGNWRVFFVHPWHNDASLSVTVTGLVVEDIGAKSANKLCYGTRTARRLQSTSCQLLHNCINNFAQQIQN